MTARPRRRPAALALAALLGVLMSPALQPTEAQAATVEVASGGPVVIHDSLRYYDDVAAILLPDGQAGRYPASVTVSDSIGSITRIEVDLVGFSHERPDDVDLLLVGPSGQAVTLMSDAGGATAVSGIDLTFGDRGTAPADEGPLSAGVLAPSDFDGSDAYPAPAPATAPGTSLAAFDGTDANGTWSLYAVDDTSGSTGSIAEGWSLVVDTAPSSAPYPSTLEVQGQSTPISDVDVTLTGLHHGFARDLDVVLVGPDGTAVTLMSDAGGSSPVDATARFSDEAGSDVPAGSEVESATYRPGNYDDPSDYEPDPFPEAGARLSAFQGRSANGTWKLYVADDSPDDEGVLDGWTLHVTTQQPPTQPLADTTPPSGTLTLLTSRGTAEVTSSRTVYLKVSASEPLAGIRVSNDGETFGPLIAPTPIAGGYPRWTLGDHDGVRRVLIQLQDLAGNVSQGYISDTVVLDRVAPRVQVVRPTSGATGIRRDAVIRARFDGLVTPNVSLRYLVRVYRVGSDKSIARTVTFDKATATIRVLPAKLLRKNTRYKVVVHSGFYDAGHNFNDQDPAKAGAQQMVWRFRTR